MNTRRTRAGVPAWKRAGTVVLCALAATAFAGCEKPPAPEAAGAKSPSPVHRYTTKGRVAQLPDPAVRGSMFQVAHEAIPDFVDRDGKVTGMNAMTMPFPPAPGVSLEGLKVGDAVEITFEVRWDRIPPQEATVVKKAGAGG